MMLEEERKKLSALSKQRAPVEQADLDSGQTFSLIQHAECLYLTA